MCDICMRIWNVVWCLLTSLLALLLVILCSGWVSGTVAALAVDREQSHLSLTASGVSPACTSAASPAVVLRAPEMAIAAWHWIELSFFMMPTDPLDLWSVGVLCTGVYQMLHTYVILGTVTAE
jgi:hypothetical protein